MSKARRAAAVKASPSGGAARQSSFSVFARSLLIVALLAIPTFLLPFAPNLAVFTTLRVAQGLCMASAFTLTLAYLGERRYGWGLRRLRYRECGIEPVRQTDVGGGCRSFWVGGQLLCLRWS